MYSIPGYSPCFFIDFTSVLDVQFMVKCMYIDNSSVNGQLRMIKDPQPRVGYEYRDVVVPPKPLMEHKILQQTVNATSYVAQFAIRDFKYLSNTNTTFVTITDPNIMAGITPGNIQLNFADLGTSDATGQTLFVVGGRAYFEVSIYGNNILSFTTKGFWDQLNYVEPVSKS